MVQRHLRELTKEELVNTLTPEYFNDDPYGAKAHNAYYQVKHKTTGQNKRRITAFKRKLQHQISAWALLYDWQCHTWRDTGTRLGGQSPTDCYFDITLCKGQCFTFVYTKPDNRPLLPDEQVWYDKVTSLNMPVVICTPSQLTTMKTLLETRDPTRETLEKLFPAKD